MEYCQERHLAREGADQLVGWIWECKARTRRPGWPQRELWSCLILVLERPEYLHMEQSWIIHPQERRVI